MEVKETKKRWKINFFDIVIIILVIALAAGFLYFRSSRQAADDSTMVDITYELELNDLNENTQGMIKEGDVLIDKVKRFEIGEVQSVEFVPFERQVEDIENGQIVSSEVPDRVSARITLKVPCQDNGATLTADSGFEIRIGKSVSVLGAGYSGAGYITGIEREAIDRGNAE